MIKGVRDKGLATRPNTLIVRVHPKSKQEKIVKLDDQSYELFSHTNSKKNGAGFRSYDHKRIVLELHFNVVPEKGKANKKVIKMISGYFNVPKSRIKIDSGLKSKEKVIEILDK